ncbi:MAG: hypothetical protein MUE73_16650 [Planctomycetes bacterium]|nr:hypothetical protein [Planctomycetota bacterium]
MIAALREATRLDGWLRQLRRERRVRQARETGLGAVSRILLIAWGVLRFGGLLVLPLVPAAVACHWRREGYAFSRSELDWLELLILFSLVFTCLLAWGVGYVRLTRFEALRIPDRAALRLARWLRGVPWCLWASLCLGTAAFHLRALAGRDPWGGGAPLLVAAVVLALAAAGGVDSLLRERLRRRSSCILSLVVCGLLVPIASLVALFGSGSVRWPASAPVMPMVIPLLIVALNALWRSRQSTWAEPAVLDRRPAVRPGTAALCVTGSAPADPAALPRVHAGRTGMRGAAAVRRSAHWRIGLGWRAPLDLGRLLLVCAGAATGPAFAVLAMVLAGRWGVPLSAPLVLAALAGLAPKSFGLPPGPRLWLFGADLREQVLENLRALLLRAAVPTLVAGWVAMALLEPTPERWLVFAALGAVFLFRAGILEWWDGTVMAGWMPHQWIPVTALAAAAFAPRGVELALYLAAAGAGLLGLLHLLATREPRLREHLRAGRWSSRPGTSQQRGRR